MPAGLNTISKYFFKLERYCSMDVPYLILAQFLQFQRRKYSRLSLSRIPRDSLKHFELSVLRKIIVAEMKKNNKSNNHI